jgi:EpsI family protein
MRRAGRFLPWPFAATALLLLGTVLLDQSIARRSPESLAVPLRQIDARILDWTAVQDQTLPAGVLRVLDPTEYLSRSYRKGDTMAEVFIAYYAQQRAGESMHSPKHCLPGAGWEIWKHDSATVPFGSGTVRVNQYSIQNNGRRLLMFYWYQSGDRIVASEYLGKVLLARDTLLTGHTAGSIVRITLPDAPGATEEGIAFSAQLIRQVQRCFGTRPADRSQTAE